MKAVRAALLTFLAVSPAYACDGLAVSAAWLRQPPPGMDMSAAYFVLDNVGDQAVRVVDVSSPDFDSAMLHETRYVDGSAGMRPVGAVDLAPGASYRAEPGGAHVMLAGAHLALDEGAQVRLVLHCASGAPRRFSVPVQRTAPVAPVADE